MAINVNVVRDAMVIPIRDLVEHEEEPTCWCAPSEIDGVLTHNAADGREEFERHPTIWLDYGSDIMQRH